jgi:multidrug efflux system outer membrane protein
MVLDGDRTQSELDLQKALFRELGAEYQQRTLVAFEEVESALANLEGYAKEFDRITAAVGWSKMTYSLFVDRFLTGLTSYINVVDAERDLLAYEMQQNVLRGYRYVATIQLIKALGGGF